MAPEGKGYADGEQEAQELRHMKTLFEEHRQQRARDAITPGDRVEGSRDRTTDGTSPGSRR